MTTHRGAGHFGPLVPFARACLRAGHDVLVAAPRPAAAMVARAGLHLHPVEEPDRAAEAEMREQIRSLAPAAAEASTIRDLFGRLRGGAALPATLEALAGWGADLVLHEISELAGPAAAARYGVPHARVGIGLAVGENAGVAGMNDALEDLRARIGAAGEGLERSPYLTLAPPSLEFPSPHPSRALRFRDPAGGARALPDWWEGSDAPLVYVSFGLPRAIRTLLEEPRYLRRSRRVAAEVAALPPVDDAVPLLEDYAEGRALAA